VRAPIDAPSALSLLTASFEGSRRSGAVAAHGTLAGIGTSLSMVAGGALADLISWRAGFFLNVPIGRAMMATAVRYLPETPGSTGRFDLLSALGSTLGVGGLVFGIEHSAAAGWTDPVTLAAVGTLALAASVLTGAGSSSRSCRCTCSPAANVPAPTWPARCSPER
jgi:hypothetical protein